MSFRSSVALLVLVLAPAAATAQRVSADIAIGQGPISGHIRIGDPYSGYHRGEIEVRRYPAYRPTYREVIVIRGHRGHGWYRNHGYRAIRVWYDAPRRIYYYDRPEYGGRGLREIVVYERDGRFIHDHADRGWRQDGRGGWDEDRHGWDEDRHGRDDERRGRHDDRRGPDRRRDDRRH